MITDTVQGRTCRKKTQLLDTQNANVYFLSGEVKKRVLKNVINCFNIFTTSAFVCQNRKDQKRNNRLQRRLELVSQGA